MTELFSDRMGRTRLRDAEQLSDVTARGLIATLRSVIDRNWLASEFPITCPDGNLVCGTDQYGLTHRIEAVVGVRWPVPLDELPEDDAIFDLVEYLGQKISKPTVLSYHSFFNHHELTFTGDPGRSEYRQEINLLLRRGGSMYELTPRMEICRLGPPELRPVYQALRLETGDVELDRLVSEGLQRYTSRDPNERRLGLEKIWDAYERLKTLETGDKKTSVALLLHSIPSQKWRDVVATDMRQLTDVGNQFQIRHFEHGQEQLPNDAQDYVFGRMCLTIAYLLRRTGRLSD